MINRLLSLQEGKPPAASRYICPKASRSGLFPPPTSGHQKQYSSWSKFTGWTLWQDFISILAGLRGFRPCSAKFLGMIRPSFPGKKNQPCKVMTLVKHLQSCLDTVSVLSQSDTGRLWSVKSIYGRPLCSIPWPARAFPCMSAMHKNLLWSLRVGFLQSLFCTVG